MTSPEIGEVERTAAMPPHTPPTQSPLIRSDLNGLEEEGEEDQSRRHRVSSPPPPEVRPRSYEAERMWFFSVTDWYAGLNKWNAATVLVLVYCNLINYMDRSTVAGMMEYIKRDPNFNIKTDKSLGLLQTAFVVFYMLTAPLFGYLGDRFSRKAILGVGLTVWSLATLLGSFSQSFWVFLCFRAVVGVGEASYSTIAPAIISDMFVGDTRSRVLALFYFAIPVGTGLGYIIGSDVAQGAHDWRWGLRVTPFMGLVAIFLIFLVMKDPPRGQSEGSQLRARSAKQDLKSLASNTSFCLSTIGFTCVAFSVGALMWWGPNFAYYGARAAKGNRSGADSITQASVSFRFGIVMTAAGLMGVPLGSYVAQALRHRVPNADPIVCGASLLASVPVLYFGFIVARYDINTSYGLTFLAGLLLNCNWAIVSDITLYIVIPIRRSLASATQILVSHALGDAISPYLIGVIADAVKAAISQNHVVPDGENGGGIVGDGGGASLAGQIGASANATSSAAAAFTKIPSSLTQIKEHTPEWFEMEFRSLQYALFICCFFQTIGGFVFLVMSWYVLEDKAKATEEAVMTSSNAMTSSSPYNYGPINEEEEEEESDDVMGNDDDDRAPVIRNTFADDVTGNDDDVMRRSGVSTRHRHDSGDH